MTSLVILTEFLIQRMSYIKMGFGYVWENQNVQNETLFFLNSFEQRMKDKLLIIIQKWQRKAAS